MSATSYQFHSKIRQILNWRLWRLSLMAAACGLLTAQAQAPGDVRVALVIGNSSYAGAPLINPANDARAMSDTLRGLGFTVVELRDGGRAQMAEAIAKVRESLKGKQGVGMLYYAGHGLQLDWHNYMVPVDARLSQATDVPAQTIDINSVIDAFKGAGNRMNILVLDACRDNPFTDKASGKGLAQLDAPPGTFLAYATAPGNVAEDGDVQSGNGLYTQFLLAELKKPTAKIEDVFKRVRLQVRQKSQGRQIPWESTSLEDDFVFNDGAKISLKAEDLERMAAEARQKEQDLQRQATQARERERQVALELERERQRLAEAQRQAELQARLAAEERARREAQELARKQAEEAAQREAQARAAQLAEAERIAMLQKLAQEKAQQEAEQLARRRAEERAQQLAQDQARERERQLALARERERQLANAQEQERERAAFAARMLAEAQRVESLRQKEVETLRAKAVEARELQKLSKEEADGREFARQKADWDKIRDSQNANDFYDYLNQYPNGLISEQANAALERLAAAKTVAVADRNGFVQIAGAGRFRVGDEATLVRKDLLTGLEIARGRQLVTRIADGVVEINGGTTLLTIDGAIIRNNFGAQFDPPRMDFPGDGFAVGKKWTAHTLQTNEKGKTFRREDKVKIVAVEDITVPAGTFKAYRFEMNSIQDNGTFVKLTYWAQPDFPFTLKMLREIRHRKGGPTMEVMELTSRKRGPAPAPQVSVATGR